MADLVNILSNKLLHGVNVANPEEVGENYTSTGFINNAVASEILHLYPDQVITEEDVEKAETILRFVKKYKLKGYFVGGNQLYYTCSTGEYMPISIDFIMREGRYGK